MITRILFLSLLFTSAGAADGWHHIKDTSTGVEFDLPCAAEPEAIQETPKVIGYSCDHGELLYLVMLVGYPKPDADEKQRKQWLDEFATGQFDQFRKRTAAQGATFKISSQRSMAYRGAAGTELQWEVAGRQASVRVIATRKVGVSLQVATKGAPLDEAARRFFDSLDPG